MGLPNRSAGRGCGGQSQLSTYSLTVSTTMAVSVSAGADAIGDATLAQVDAGISVVSRGLISYAIGDVTALAAAQGGAAYASSYAAVSTSDGTVLHWEETLPVSDAAVQISQASFGVIDLGGLAAAGLQLSCAPGGPPCDDRPDGCGSPPAEEGPARALSLSGNLADFDVRLSALGDNGLVDLAADALALDGLSSVAVSATAAVSETTDYQVIQGGHAHDTITTTDANTIVRGEGGNDDIHAGSGNDWLLGGGGDDLIACGKGDDAAYGGGGDDVLDGGFGNDWLFGGRGDDLVGGGAGADLLLGGAGDDRLNGHGGADLLDGGRGADTIRGGPGDDVFRLGADHGDGDDRFVGGSGADAYWLTGAFGSDKIMDFNIAEGDRLIRTSGGWSEIGDLLDRNGAELTMCRARGDADDLQMDFRFGRDGGTLTLDEFFVLNAEFDASVPARGNASDAQAALLLSSLFGDDAGTFAAAGIETFLIGSLISELA